MATRTIYEIKDGNGNTTDNSTPVALVTYDVSTAIAGSALNNCTIFANGTAVGYDAGFGVAMGERVAAVFKVVSGTLSQVGTTVHVTGMIFDETGTPNSTFSVSGNVISYVVTGTAARTINWWGRIDFTVYQPT